MQNPASESANIGNLTSDTPLDCSNCRVVSTYVNVSLSVSQVALKETVNIVSKSKPVEFTQHDVFIYGIKRFTKVQKKMLTVKSLLSKAVTQSST